VSFAEQVRKVLKKPEDLPQEFLDYLIQYAAVHPTPLGALRAPMIISTGTTGATYATRWVGSTTSGSPTTGYGVVGDFITTQDATIWICTVAGSPGTWVQVGGSGLPYLNQSVLAQGTNTTHTITTGTVTAIPWDTYTSSPGYGAMFGATPTTSNPVTFAKFATAVVTVTVVWPAANYDRYVELTVGSPSTGEYISSPRLRHAVSPDGDLQTLTAVISGDPSNPTTITTNVFQASGVNRAITAGISFHSIPYGVAPYVLP
jgi:hypothetical protein